MVVIGRFLHQIAGRPKERKANHAPSVLIANHDKQSKEPHYGIPGIHAISGQGLKPFKANKRKGL